MAYSATVLRLLISSPNDIQEEDKAAVRRAIMRWNALQGDSFEHVVIPVSWSEDAAAEFGSRPQEAINRQLVDDVDLGIALFWNRLGTPTESRASGTDEEIVDLDKANKPVSVLRCAKPVPPSGDHAERQRLDDYFREVIEPRGLVVSYSSPLELERHVDTILTRLVRRYEREWAVATPQGGRRGGSQVVVTTWREQYTKHNSKGQPKSSTRYHLKFVNTGGVEARDIKWELSEINGVDGELPPIGGSEGSGTIPVLSASGGEVDYSMLMHGGIADQFTCHVKWTENGHPRENETTLRP